jgi:hypothetical protein
MKDWNAYGRWRHPEIKWACVFSSYMKKKHPNKLIYEPKICEITKDEIRFGMKKHMGVFILSKQKILEELENEK